jgi:hypothetical protein
MEIEHRNYYQIIVRIQVKGIDKETNWGKVAV